MSKSSELSIFFKYHNVNTNTETKIMSTRTLVQRNVNLTAWSTDNQKWKTNTLFNPKKLSELKQRVIRFYQAC